MFTTETPDKLVGKSLIESQIRQESGCNVLSIKKDSQQFINPQPNLEIPDESELVLIGTTNDEKRFMEVFKG